MATFTAFLSQGFPPKPQFTEKDLGDLAGKVFIISGGYSGIGLELTKMVFRKNATVYVAGRSEETARKSIEDLQSTVKSDGRLEYLPLDLSDLSTIKESASRFLEREKRLDVLWNNAAIMGKTAESKQGHEIHLATNCLGPFLFTQLLHPVLASTAKIAPSGSVRVIWLASFATHLHAPPGGMDLNNMDYKKKNENDAVRYAVSKVGNLFIAAEWARRDAGSGILHLPLNPGNLKSPLQRNMSKLEKTVLNPLLHEPVLGAYTELFAGLSPTIKQEDSGRYIIPWGRFGALRTDLQTEVEESRNATRFFDYCDRITKGFL